MWVCASPEAHRVSSISRCKLYWECSGHLTKGNGSAEEVGEITVVVSLCFALCRLVSTAATAVVVVYVTMQAVFGGGKPTS